MELKDQARLCSLQMQQLEESVIALQKAKSGSNRYFIAGYETPKNSQQNKTAVLRQVVALRQSLLALAKEVG
ncbi:MAG: hypothetical protein IJ131_09705 [Eggerthellaceae bacterium]|nr:hypothetical protein [Eggerthellaceae bacterium]